MYVIRVGNDLQQAPPLVSSGASITPVCYYCSNVFMMSPYISITLKLSKYVCDTEET